jgi:hypothetical protein
MQNHWDVSWLIEMNHCIYFNWNGPSYSVCMLDWSDLNNQCDLHKSDEILASETIYQLLLIAPSNSSSCQRMNLSPSVQSQMWITQYSSHFVHYWSQVYSIRDDPLPEFVGCILICIWCCLYQSGNWWVGTKLSSLQGQKVICTVQVGASCDYRVDGEIFVVKEKANNLACYNTLDSTADFSTSQRQNLIYIRWIEMLLIILILNVPKEWLSSSTLT